MLFPPAYAASGARDPTFGQGGVAAVVDGHRLRLRAERAGGGNGRTYTITITCTDSAGASTTRPVKVQVPKSQGPDRR